MIQCAFLFFVKQYFSRLKVRKKRIVLKGVSSIGPSLVPNTVQLLFQFCVFLIEGLIHYFIVYFYVKSLKFGHNRDFSWYLLANLRLSSLDLLWTETLIALQLALYHVIDAKDQIGETGVTFEESRTIKFVS